MFLLFKVFSLYLVTIAVMRLMGKSSIVQMTPYDLVAIIIIGTIASEPLISTEFWPTLLALGFLVVFHILFSMLTLNQIGNRFFLGEPTLIIKNGVILEDNLEKSHLSVSQVLAILRSKGYPKVSDVEYALLEPIGEVSVIPKAENTPVTVKHINVHIDDEGLPISVIVDGRIQYRNLKLLGLDKEWLMEELAKKTSIKKMLFMGLSVIKRKTCILISVRKPKLNLKEFQW